MRLDDMLATAKITAKGQTTVPLPIREALRIQPGDRVIWEITAEGLATMRRVEAPADAELAEIEVTLTEWAGADDEAAYRDL